LADTRRSRTSMCFATDPHPVGHPQLLTHFSRRPTKNPTSSRQGFVLVEVAGIEPASAKSPLSVLHA